MRVLNKIHVLFLLLGFILFNAIASAHVFFPDFGAGIDLMWELFLLSILGLGAFAMGSAYGKAESSEPKGIESQMVSSIRSMMVAIEHENLSTAKVDAEELRGILERAKTDESFVRKYRDDIEAAERLINGTEMAYHDFRLNTEEENIREIMRSPSPFDDIALYTSTGMLSWKDPFDIVSWGHSLAGYIGLESREQAYENIVRIKAEQMLEMEDNMGTAEHPNLLGILKQGASSPFAVGAFAAGGGFEAAGNAVDSFLEGHEILSAGFRAVDMGFNAMYAFNVFDDIKKGNWEGVVGDIGFIGLVSGISKIGEILPKELIRIKNIAEKQNLPRFNEFLDYAMEAEGSNWVECDGLKNVLNTLESIKKRGHLPKVPERLLELPSNLYNGLLRGVRGFYAELVGFRHFFDEERPKKFVDLSGGDMVGYRDGIKYLLEMKASTQTINGEFKDAGRLESYLKRLTFNAKKEKAIPAIGYVFNMGKIKPKILKKFGNYKMRIYKVDVNGKVKGWKITKHGGLKRVR